MNLKPAFFISPDGEYIVVQTTHIAEIIKHPGRFALTLEQVTEIYAEHHEPLGLEGIARATLIKMVVERGWIRLRRYPDSGWSVTVDRLDEGTLRRLTDWARKIVNEGIEGIREIDRYTLLNIVLLRDACVSKRMELDTLLCGNDETR